MTFDEWVASLPDEIKGDTLWKMEAYRLALFATEIGWHDITKLMKDRRTQGLSDQLYRSLGSVSANLAEGYSHHTGKSRAQFYQYALGSARESRDWYYKLYIGENRKDWHKNERTDRRVLTHSIDRAVGEFYSAVRSGRHKGGSR